MPRHCSAGGCKSRDNRETRNAGITFHKLPKGAPRRNLWITNSHRADSWDPQTDFVYFCSKHFTPESFELTGCSGIRRLKEDAFPTVFDSSSTTKCRGAGPPQTPQDIPIRKNPCLSDQEDTQQDTDRGPTSDEATVQRSVAAAEDSSENTPAPSQEPPVGGEEQISQQDCGQSPGSRPLSPSCYMRRLPPPPGFYLPKEHSYAQLCPLMWRKRYNQAIDCLEKALRQLHAARRRENRLRSTVLRLRDKRLRHTLLVSQDGCKKRVSRTPEREKRREKGGSYQVESDTIAKYEDTGLFEDMCVDDQMELGNQFLPDTTSWSEEEKGYCFYCGTGQVQVDRVACKVSKSGKDAPPTAHRDSAETSTCCTAESAKDRQVVRREKTKKSVEIVDSSSQVLPQTQVQHVSPAKVTLPDIHEHNLQLLGSQQKLLLTDTCEADNEAQGQEHHLDLQQQQQQLFWIQDITEGQVILVPVSAEDGLQSFIKMEEVADEAQTILVSEVDLKGDMEDITENSRGLPRVEPGCDDEHREHQSVMDTTPGTMGEDVREKLKEHLEGFHLQLSTEFIN
ncbi:THAP domain-containing protein 7 [Centropristis striata]|uniref:THAP domain-containing protein 7 n=1 Tax=Centropristis striata TaxID=184440 RepID=UPI0027E150B2|nr:THAP domain-containing protein 7 [Centropristis striata]XP_059206786.1 THAP domain-containing protein 7 [Centropristis striata]XP_059206789.1 THAP domain-containing protein 7 [Centropristis striata]